MWIIYSSRSTIYDLHFGQKGSMGIYRINPFRQLSQKNKIKSKQRNEKNLIRPSHGNKRAIPSCHCLYVQASGKFRGRKERAASRRCRNKRKIPCLAPVTCGLTRRPSVLSGRICARPSAGDPNLSAKESTSSFWRPTL